MERDKHVDESWKDSIDQEKNKIIVAGDDLQKQSAEGEESIPADGDDLTFFNYIASLGFQALIFMGETPNPITNQVEKNLKQAKFLIDTLVLLREKTKGNLTTQENNLLNGSVYELQMKYVEIMNKELN